MPADREALRALLTLRFAPGVGDRRRAVLLLRNGSPESALEALRRSDPAAHERLMTPTAQRRIAHALHTVETTPDLIVLSLTEQDYPARLRDLADPPAVLFVRGDLHMLARPTIAIVGTRAHTAYGEDVARSVASALARAGALILSGLAHGIDRFAHEAALAAGGATAAVVGCGIDVPYPRQHSVLLERIAREGLVLSEFLPGTPPLPHHFPQRNRIIAALANALVIVEAPAMSGALITAGHALEIGREVLAVPGPIGRRSSEGTNALLRDGAAMLLDPLDALAPARLAASREGGGQHPGLLCVAGPTPARARADRMDPIPGAELLAAAASRARPDTDPGAGSAGPADADLANLRAALADEPVHADDLACAAGMAPARAVAALLELELTGEARQVPGLRFARAVGPATSKGPQLRR